MTDQPGTICKRCGFSNIPGDQFCGSCGAFLPWEGQPSDALPGEPGTPNVPAPVDPAVPDEASVSWGAPYGDPLPTPPPVPAWPDDDEDDDRDLVRCPACGIANPSNRTFCQSCGTTLAAAARVGDASDDEIAAAVAMKPTPVSDASASTSAARGTPGEKGGIPSWVIGVGVVGLLVGAAIVLGGLALRGPGPDSGATGSGDVPSGVASSGAPETSGPSGSASAPGTPVPLALTKAKASSVFGDKAKFQPGMAIDGDPDTAWQEGAQQEKDQWIEVAFDASRADSLIVRNGYQASQAQFRGNRRLKDVLVTVNGGKAIPFRLKDTMKPQQIDLGGVTGASKVRITIVSTWPGEATSVQGTPFDDAAVSELTVVGVPGG